MNFYPTGLERGKTKIPHGKSFGRIKCNNSTAYGFGEVIFADKKENPTLFIDLESPRKEYKVMNGTEIHFGISADFKRNENYGKQKPHIDIYIPLSELDLLIQSLAELRDSIKQPMTIKTQTRQEVL